MAAKLDVVAFQEGARNPRIVDLVGGFPPDCRICPVMVSVERHPVPQDGCVELISSEIIKARRRLTCLSCRLTKFGVVTTNGSNVSGGAHEQRPGKSGRARWLLRKSGQTRETHH